MVALIFFHSFLVPAALESLTDKAPSVSVGQQLHNYTKHIMLDELLVWECSSNGKTLLGRLSINNLSPTTVEPRITTLGGETLSSQRLKLN